MSDQLQQMKKICTKDCRSSKRPSHTHVVPKFRFYRDMDTTSPKFIGHNLTNIDDDEAEAMVDEAPDAAESETEDASTPEAEDEVTPEEPPPDESEKESVEEQPSEKEEDEDPQE